MTAKDHHALGVMSGTSLDGIDLAFVVTDGLTVKSIGPSGYFPYSDADRAVLRQSLEAAKEIRVRISRPPALELAEELVTERHIQAIGTFLEQKAIDRLTIDVIGFHGQTVFHNPSARLTVQLGDGARLAYALKIPVIADMRAADVAAGGQGAPLVPVYHQALVAGAGLEGPTLVVNLGGVANITYLDPSGALIACDTGPANALIDDLMLERMGVAMDRDGAAAARGRVDEAALAMLLAHPFFAMKPPKSLDRNAFSRAPVAALTTEDAAATLSAFTAASLALIVPHLPLRPRRAILCGGGARNPTLARMIETRLGMPVRLGADLGWDGDALEAQAFAFLAVRSLLGLPLSFPGTTGVPAPMTGGVLYRP